jgi:hypothetical protein
MRAVDLPPGETIPVLGTGTWHLAEGRHPPEVELDALRTGAPPTRFLSKCCNHRTALWPGGPAYHLGHDAWL